jgi:repressor LexA
MRKDYVSQKVLEKMQKVRVFINNYTKNHDYSPSIRDICKFCEIPSTASALYYVRKLIKNGELDKNTLPSRVYTPKHYNKTFNKVPIIDKITTENTCIFDEVNVIGLCPLPNEFSSESNCFALKIKDNLMINSGLVKGDIAICKNLSYFSNGDLAVVLIDNEAKVRRVFNENCILLAKTDNNSENAQDNLHFESNIIGKVIGLIRKF